MLWSVEDEEEVQQGGIVGWWVKGEDCKPDAEDVDALGKDGRDGRGGTGEEGFAEFAESEEDGGELVGGERFNVAAVASGSSRR